MEIRKFCLKNPGNYKALEPAGCGKRKWRLHSTKMPTTPLAKASASKYSHQPRPSGCGRSAHCCPRCTSTTTCAAPLSDESACRWSGASGKRQTARRPSSASRPMCGTCPRARSSASVSLSTWAAQICDASLSDSNLALSRSCLSGRPQYRRRYRRGLAINYSSKYGRITLLLGNHLSV